MFGSDTRTRIAETAKSLGVLPAALLAVAEVESGGRTGAKVKGRIEPMIRFEGHYFYRLLPKRLRVIARDQGLAHPKAEQIKNPRHQARRWTRLEKAIKINRIAALSAVSWGVGQVMGSHWRWLGYGSVDVLVQEARSGIAGQVRLMARFIRKSGLVEQLNAQDWAGFARTYNGPGYRKNRYDTKLAAAFARYQQSAETASINGNRENSAEKPLLKTRSTGRAVRELQQLLRADNASLLVDGRFGRQTRLAVQKFQKNNGLTGNGIVGPETWALLARMANTNSFGRNRAQWQPVGRFFAWLMRLFRL